MPVNVSDGAGGSGEGALHARSPGLGKILGRTPQTLPWHTILAASVAGGLTIAILGLTGDIAHTPLLIAAFGSSCVLVFLLPEATLSRPANVVGGHIVSAVCGLVVHTLLPVTWWSLGLAVALAMISMSFLRVIHPPAGGTPLAVMLLHEGWGYLLTPVLAGALMLCACALSYQAALRRLSRRAAPTARDATPELSD